MAMQLRQHGGTFTFDPHSIGFRRASGLLSEELCVQYEVVPLGFMEQAPEAPIRVAGSTASATLVLGLVRDDALAPVRGVLQHGKIATVQVTADKFPSLLRAAYPPIDASCDAFRRAAGYLDRDLCFKYRVAPVLELAENIIVVAAATPAEIAALHIPRVEIIPRIIPSRDKIFEYINLAYPETSAAYASAEALMRMDQVVLDMMRRGGSSVHIETDIDGTVRVFFRIFSRLREQPQHQLPPDYPARLLNAANEALGRSTRDSTFFNALNLRRNISGRTVDVRLATAPILTNAAAHGDTSAAASQGGSVVIRVAQDRSVFTLFTFGLRDDSLQRLMEISERPGKLVAITAPSGEGKSSLLRAIFAWAYGKHPDQSFREIGSPIERVVRGLRSTEVDDNMDPQQLLEQFLLMEPDWVFFSELRRNSWFHLAFDAASRVHKVLCTTHLLYAYDGLLSLVQKTDAATVAQYLDAVVGIRLLDTLCECSQSTKRPFAHAKHVEEWFAARAGAGKDSQSAALTAASEANAVDTRIKAALVRFDLPVPTHVAEQNTDGCKKCQHLVHGLSTRRPVIEIFEVTPEVSAALFEHRLHNLASLDTRYRPMAYEGLQYMLEGHVTPNEVARQLRL